MLARSLVVAVLVLLIAAAGPPPAAASPLRYESRTVTFETYCCWDYGGSIEFGGDQAAGDDTFRGFRVPDDRLDGVSRAMGRIALIAGPLLSVLTREDDNGNPIRSRYEYGPGMLWAHVPALNGEVGWSFAATLWGLVINLCEPVEDDDCFGGMPYGDATATLGPGLFSPEIAAALGVQRQSRGGAYWMAMDEIEGLFGDEDRVGPKNLSGLTVQAVVPEPGLSALMLVGLGLLGRARHVRARRSASAFTILSVRTRISTMPGEKRAQ